MLLIIGRRWLKFDVYLLRFSEGSEIKQHKDTVEAGQHFRLNIILKNAIEGGVFISDGVLFQTKHIKFFRPDIHQHGVTKVIKGRRYVLSIGWVTGTQSTQ